MSSIEKNPNFFIYFLIYFEQILMILFYFKAYDFIQFSIRLLSGKIKEIYMIIFILPD